MTIAIALVLYVALVIGIGVASNRRSEATPEDYFLAGRGLGTVVLFMALFGTNATAFVLVGIPGRAYHDGVAVFGVNAPIIALGIPMCFWLIGSPARRMAMRLGALTPAELYRKRFDSRALGLLLFAVYALYTVPYMVTAVKGAAVTLTGVTEGAVPQWVGGAAVMAVALLYTTIGGMRATAWTNVFQGSLFLVFMVVAFVLMAQSLGGFEAATAAVVAHDPSLLQIGDGPLYTPGGWTSWSFAITLTVIGFPHMLVRLMAGKSEDALRAVSRYYPIALLLLWVPAVMIGVWGAAAFPGLEGRASDRIFSLMSANHLPAAFGSLGFVAVLAAVMSTLDAQILVLSSMLVRDVLESPKDAVKAGRWFGVAISVVVFVLSITWGSSVFEIASFAFSGYVTLAPVLFFGVRWRSCTRQAAIASIVVGNVVLALGTAELLPMFGFLPVFWALVAGTITAVVVSRVTDGRGAVEAAFS